MDDVLVVWTTPEYIDVFPEALTLEQFGLVLKKDQPSNTLIHFLDLNIKIHEQIISTTVYRKPSYEAILIPNWSNDPIAYKKTAFHTFYKRALTYCSNDDNLSDELAYIQKIGLQHGFSRSFLKGILNNVKSKLNVPVPALPSQPQDVPGTFAPVPYSLKNLQVVKSAARRSNRKLATHRGPTLFNLIRNEKDQT